MKQELTVRFEPGERELLEQFAKGRGLGLAAALRMIVREHLGHMGEQGGALRTLTESQVADLNALVRQLNRPPVMVGADLADVRRVVGVKRAQRKPSKTRKAKV